VVSKTLIADTRTLVESRVGWDGALKTGTFDGNPPSKIGRFPAEVPANDILGFAPPQWPKLGSPQSDSSISNTLCFNYPSIAYLDTFSL